VGGRTSSNLRHGEDHGPPELAGPGAMGSHAERVSTGAGMASRNPGCPEVPRCDLAPIAVASVPQAGKIEHVRKRRHDPRGR
jgi:hypothetical protein